MAFAAPDGVELIEPLGNGSVFEVALVRTRGAIAVCKRLAPRVRREPAGRAAIVREAKILARARHPALPELLRVGTDGHGPFLLEGHVAGVSLARLGQGWLARGRAVPPALLAHVASSAAAALAELHELCDEAGPIGLVHGDLGPEHVILGPIGDVGFVDLGAARFAGMEPELDTGDRGTLPFVAPEVARGDARPSAAADVYALAATLLFLATGGPICATRDEGAMLLEIGERGLDPTLCDEAVGLGAIGRAALKKALALDPAARLADARELAAALAHSASERAIIS